MLLLPIAVIGWPALATVPYPGVHADAFLRFPADEGAHPAFRSEWWYVTGFLDNGSRSVGFQVTFFRSRPGVNEQSGSRFAPRQLLFAHAAIADPAAGRLAVDQRAARAGFDAKADERVLDVRVVDWWMRRRGDRYAASIRARDFALDLEFDARAPVLLQGSDGLSRKGPSPDDASYYYSQPQLAVEGRVSGADGTRRVTGVAWLDHEWSSRYLPDGAVGWDWMGINLDDGAALMAFRIRDAAGATLWAGGSHRDAHGAVRIFAPADVAFAAARQWQSTRTGIAYPVAFDVRAGNVQLRIEPLLDDQELDARASVGTIYWEGAVRASIDGQPAGRGYVELTGYGKPLRL
ncbi:MAG: lipocalin-like domain-containing protein [Betaproteobacteria bacterium]